MVSMNEHWGSVFLSLLSKGKESMTFPPMTVFRLPPVTNVAVTKGVTSSGCLLDIPEGDMALIRL